MLKALLSSEFPSAVPPSAFPGDLELAAPGAPLSLKPRLGKGAEA